MRQLIIVLSLLVPAAMPALAQENVGFGEPIVNLGINFPVYPQFQSVPGYPVYYAPQVDANYFFYDGMYWVFQNDNWYASSWYNGPWSPVSSMVVPVYILRVPVRYYREPPQYFHGWRQDAPPHWGDHWGSGWASQHPGWDRWNRAGAPEPAPLPAYQQPYSGKRYPNYEQQLAISNQNYHYQPHDPAVQEHYKKQQQSRIVPASVPTPNQVRPPAEARDQGVSEPKEKQDQRG